MSRTHVFAGVITAALVALVLSGVVTLGPAGAQPPQPPSITSDASTTFTVNQAGSFTVTTTGDAPMALSETGALPSGVTFTDNGDGTATLAGTPQVGTGGSYPITITASNGVPPDATQDFTLTDLEPPTITSNDAATFTVGQAGTFTVTTTPGYDAAGDGQVSLGESGSLPAGVTFTDNGDGTATLAGTPQVGTGGSYSITITASNGVPPDATQDFTLTDLEPPTITSNDAATFTVGQAGTFTVTTTPGYDAAGDGQVSLGESGSLPAGVTFTDNGDGTATLAGTPHPGTANTYDVVLTASNGVSPSRTQAFALTIDNAAPTTVTISGPSSVNSGAPYSATASAPGASPAPTFTLATGAPTWLHIGATSGALSGSPPSSPTTFSYQVTATNAAGSATSSVQTVTVVIAPTSVTVDGPSSQVVGTEYQATATGSGADVPLTYSFVSGAPSWLSINSSTGAISGIIPEGNPHYYSYQVVASDSDGSATSSSQFVTIDPGQTSLTLTASPGTSVQTGTQVKFKATVNETEGFGTLSGTVSFTKNNAAVSGCTSLPLSGSSASCFITFTAAGNVTITATYANDSFFTGSSGSVVEVVTSGAAPQFTSAAGTSDTVDTAFSFAVGATGTPTPTISSTGSLPSGVSFTSGGSGSGSATIAGTPAAGTGGTYTVTLKATNSAGSTTQSFTLTIDQPSAFTSAASASATVGSALSFKVTTSGYPVATVSESGALPTGVTFSAKSNGTATIAGTPAAGTGGTYDVTLGASNGIGSPASQSFVLSVAQGPTFSSPANDTAVVGSSFVFDISATGPPSPAITETGTLPSGVTFIQGVNGAATLSGKPAAKTGGTYVLTLKAKNSAGTAAQTFTLTVDQAVAITSAASAKATVGSALSFEVTTTGYPPPALSETGALPPGVRFVDNGDGTASIVGTPSGGSAGTYAITITAANGIGRAATQGFTIKVKA